MAIDPTTTDLWSALADLHGTAPFLFGPTPATAAFIEASGADAVRRCGYNWTALRMK